MSKNRLFSLAKVPVYCDAITHALETRRDSEVKVCTLTLRVQPFDAKYATSLDDGLKTDMGVRASLFSLNTAEPKSHLRRVDFALGVPRQNLEIFASSDTAKASIALEHVKLTGTYARTEKNVNGYAFVFKAAFGPASKGELEFIQDWLLGQRFVSFEESDPSLEFDPESTDEEDGEAEEVQTHRPLEFEDPRDDKSADDQRAIESGAGDKEPARVVPHRHSNRKAAVKAKQRKGRR